MGKFQVWKESTVIEEHLELVLPAISNIKISLLKLDSEDNITTEGKGVYNSTNKLPFAVEDVQCINGTLTRRKPCTSGKEVLAIDLDLTSLAWKYQPGDTIGILPENKPEDVEKLLCHIGVQSMADQLMQVKNDDPKQSYLPKYTNYREIITKYLNLYAIPMKQAIATLAQHTSDILDRRKLELLASRQGTEIYREVILEAGTGFLEFLLNFSTCKPPVEVLVQLMPRLLPRPYSIASSPLTSPHRMLVALTILPVGQEGICTGMLRRGFTDSSEMSLNVYLRKSNGFRLPDDDNAPLILVGPGTGVAPFLGFLDHMSLTRTERQVYLFTGYREEDDFTFMHEIKEHLSRGTLTKLFVSYSRQEGPHAKYVQEDIKNNWQDVGNAILKDGFIYVCGDIQAFSKSVVDAFVEVIEKHTGITHEEAVEKVKELRRVKRYLEDIWT